MTRATIAQPGYANMYDALPLNENMQSSDRLFGNRHIGRYELSNLVVPRELRNGGDRVDTEVFHMYARTNLPRSPLAAGAREVIGDAFIEGDHDLAIKMVVDGYRDRSEKFVRAFDDWAHHTVVTIRVGDRTHLAVNMHDLLGSPSWRNDDNNTYRRKFPASIIIPYRQSFHVNVDQFRTEDLLSAIAALPRPSNIGDPWRLWIHAECLYTETAAPDGPTAAQVLEPVGEEIIFDEEEENPL